MTDRILLIPLLHELERAISRRDKRETYRLMARMLANWSDGKPADIGKVRAVAHTYAAELFGWEMCPEDQPAQGE